MKDKEKQIEEMAKIMCENDCEECRRESIEFYGNSYDEDTQCVFNVGAERLYEQGYRKIPEDSVVLSREEYTNYMVEYMGVKEIKERVSKETAEKIFKKLITRLKDCPEVIEEGYNVQNSVDYFEDIIGYDKFCADETIKKLANEFGVEIKE